MNTREERLKEIEKAITVTKDFPKPGIYFRDFLGILRSPSMTETLLDELHHVITHSIMNKVKSIDCILGLESRGFLLGPALTMRLNCAFVPARKAGKLPGSCHTYSYDLEYGSATLEIQKNAIKPGDNVILFDDLLATGGSLQACVKLIEMANANCVASLVIMELVDLEGRSKLERSNVPVHSIFKF